MKEQPTEPRMSYNLTKEVENFIYNKGRIEFQQGTDIMMLTCKSKKSDILWSYLNVNLKKIPSFLIGRKWLKHRIS